MSKRFDTLWGRFWDLSDGLILDQKITTEHNVLYSTSITGEYFNTAVPISETINQEVLEDSEHALAAHKHKPSITLLPHHIDKGATEHIIRLGYKLYSNSAWMALEPSQRNPRSISADIQEIELDRFDDFDTVLSEVFKDFAGMAPYQQMCRETLLGKTSTTVTDLRSRFFVIYDRGKPASGAALFSSKAHDFAYLHNAGTLPEFRGKGYQTALIQHRINLALEESLTDIFTLVEFWSQSWSNMIKNGFNQAGTTYILTKPAKK